MKPEGLLSCAQEPSTGLYPKPDQSNPSHPISLRSILILSTHLRLGLPSGLFPSVFPSEYSRVLYNNVIYSTCCPAGIMAGTPTIITKILRGIPQSVRLNAGIET
jgi:hypothetical protein